MPNKTKIILLLIFFFLRNLELTFPLWRENKLIKNYNLRTFSNYDLSLEKEELKMYNKQKKWDEQRKIKNK